VECVKIELNGGQFVGGRIKGGDMIFSPDCANCQILFVNKDLLLLLLYDMLLAYPVRDYNLHGNMYVSMCVI
jgi:hypothetical protein